MIWALGQDVMADKQPLIEAVGIAMGTVTDVRDNEAQTFVTNFQLFQNYPNPFNPNTTISFQLENQTAVKLSIYDATGRLVTVLQDGVALQGLNQATWDATGQASGVYFYRLEAGADFNEVKQMVLVK
jgi:hypothetical protein